MTFLPAKFLLVGLFLIAAFISTSIGTSMGTIATIAPIGFALSQHTNIDPSLCMGTVVGGAMFGDNLSIISDTTIAAISACHADVKLKFKLNFKIAILTTILTIIVLLLQTNIELIPTIKDYNVILITPYILITVLAISGINIFVSLLLGIIYAGILG